MRKDPSPALPCMGGSCYNWGEYKDDKSSQNEKLINAITHFLHLRQGEYPEGGRGWIKLKYRTKTRTINS